MEHIKDYFANIPEYIKPIVDTGQPNQSIKIFEDANFHIKTAKREILVTGNIEYKWFPQIGVFFEGFTEKFEHFMSEEDNFKVLDPNGADLGEAFIIREYSNLGKWFVKGVFAMDCNTGDKLIPVKEIRFVVPNMSKFHGQILKDENKSYRGGMHFSFEGYSVILDMLPDFEERIASLKKNGGYHITYSGKIVLDNAVNLNGIRKKIEILNCFLKILNGKQVSAFFFTGMHEGENIWQDFRSYPVEPYHERGYSCFPLNLRSSDIDSLGILYGNIQHFWRQEDQKAMIISAIGWYLEANTKPYYQFDTSLIISQSALEMFFNWLMIEKDKILRGKISLSAANKIRLLLARVGVKTEVPIAYSNLNKFLSDTKNNNEEDAVDAIVLYRNAIVHGEYEKRIKLQTFTPSFKQEAKNLSIWYLELCILYVLNYNGKYSNRTNSKYVTDSELVPWNAATIEV